MDKSSGEKAVKLEPRIVKVLEILIRNSPSVVTREELIEEVWDNYGGAEDALNHAISQLRKVLHDTDKQNRLIETIPKKGYRLNTVERRHHEKRWNRNWIVWAVALLFIMLLGFFAYRSFFQEAAVAPPAPDGKTTEQTHERAPVPKAED